MGWFDPNETRASPFLRQASARIAGDRCARPRTRTAEIGGVPGSGGPCPSRCQHLRPFSLLTAGRTRNSLLLTCNREGSTQIILGKRLMVLDEPWLEVAVNNPG